MKNFEKNGFSTQNGLGMLINQAAESFRLGFNINLTNKDIIEAKELCEKVLKLQSLERLVLEKQLYVFFLKSKVFKF